MNIGTHLVNNFDGGIQGRVQSEQTKETGNANAARAVSNLTGLKEGTVFKGEILDITGDKVTIELEHQEKMQARLQDGVELGVGDRLLFSVKENHNNQVLIKPLFDSLYSAKTQMLEKILDAAKLSPTERNFTAVKELMDAGMPVDKGSIVKILSQNMKFEGTSLQTLVSLNKMNIPVTAENIAQYERYQNYNHQLSGDIAKTIGSITDFINAMPKDLSAKNLLSLTDDILDIFSQDVEQAGIADEAAFLERIGKNGTSDVRNAGDMTVLEGEMETSGYDEFLLKEQAKDAVMQMNAMEETVENSPKDTDRQKLGEQAEKLGVNKEVLQDFSYVLQKSGMSLEQIRTIFQNANSLEGLLEMVTKTLADNGAEASAVCMVAGSEGFKDMLSDIIKNGWSLNPKTMKSPKEIDELYEKMTKQSRAFEEAISARGGDTGQFQQNSQNMRQNMSFIEQLNNQMIYAQLPLKLSNQNVNSELYVYADKRKLAEKKDGISVMLHLDMDYLGMTDIKVTLTGNNVNARFYLNDQKSVEIMTENMKQLESKLKERGFSLTNEVVKRQPAESINKVVDEIVDENAEKSIKRYTFDVKM